MSFGQSLANSATRIAKKMGNTKSLGKCALAVGDSVSAVLGEHIACQFRGNAYEWLPKLKSELGQRYWKFFRQTANTMDLPAGTIVLWDKQPAHPYGHIEIADGKGHLISDFIRDDFRPIYVSNPANVVPYLFIPLNINCYMEKQLPFDVKVTVNELNLREEPNLTSKIITTIPNGTIMTVWAIKTDIDRQWGKNSKGYFCLFDSQKGYVEVV